MPAERPERQWQMLGRDLFVLGAKTYLLVVDYFSRYVEMAQLAHNRSTDNCGPPKVFFLPVMGFQKFCVPTTDPNILDRLLIPLRLRMGLNTSLAARDTYKVMRKLNVQSRRRKIRKMRKTPTWLFSSKELHIFSVVTAQHSSSWGCVFATGCQLFPLNWTLNCQTVLHSLGRRRRRRCLMLQATASATEPELLVCCC